MSVLAEKDPLRPAAGGVKGWIGAQAVKLMPQAFDLLRGVKPILKLGSVVVVTRYDDVRDVFRRDADFDTPYKTNIEILTGGEPFFLGMRNTPDYHEDLATMRKVFLSRDLSELGDRAEALAAQIVERAHGRLEIVGDLVRKVTFELFGPYIGIPEPPDGELDVWTTRLFAFQFTSGPDDSAFMAEVDEFAPALRDHIDKVIQMRKAEVERAGTADVGAAGGQVPGDDVLGRCLALQAGGNEKLSDVFIRTNLLCMIVGGPPQIPMVAPHALEQLLRRPKALALAQQAAKADDDALLWKIVREAMRFDPLAPALRRITTKNAILAKGLGREVEVQEGSTVLVAFSSAMKDGRRLRDPGTFDPLRQDHEYIHFGHGLHECFGRFMNEAVIHRILKPLLQRSSLIRAAGDEGQLSKRGVFSDRLTVKF